MNSHIRYDIVPIILGKNYHKTFRFITASKLKVLKLAFALVFQKKCYRGAKPIGEVIFL